MKVNNKLKNENLDNCEAIEESSTTYIFKIEKNDNSISKDNNDKGNEENIDFEEGYVNLRIDTFLKLKLKDLSRSFIQKLIDEGNLLVNDKPSKASYKLKENDEIIFTLPELKELEVIKENIPLDIIYEDESLAIINKPVGMVVHPAVGNYTGTMVNALLYHLKDLSGVNGVIRPGIVHRIDKDTSGLLVVAKNDIAHRELSKQLKDHSMTREYFALCEGRIKNDFGTIEGNLARDPKNRLKYAVRNEGKYAKTHYKVIARYKNATLLKVNLETGRTHQIRVHMAHIGHPLVGDLIYGYKNKISKSHGQLLHAHKLGFIHPITKKYIEFHRAIPLEFKNEILKKKREK